jgi:hypothetical protein
MVSDTDWSYLFVFFFNDSKCTHGKSRLALEVTTETRGSKRGEGHESLFFFYISSFPLYPTLASLFYLLVLARLSTYLFRIPPSMMY